jgi:hypothetical protein
MADPTIETKFPNDFFPPGLEQFRQSAARSIGIADEYLVGPMLAAASVGIGTAMTAVLKADWLEPASLFVATVGYKSSGKTPAAKHALKPLEDQQREREKQSADHQSTSARMDLDDEHSEPGRAIPGEDGGSDCDDGDDETACDLCDEDDVASSSPQLTRTLCQHPTPQLQHLVVHDTTHAALWQVLEHSPRGVIVSGDELSTVFLESKPAQRQVWCEIYQAGPRTIHRKVGKRGTIILPKTFVTLSGGIQPDLFTTIGGKYDGGLLERFLICGKPETSLPPWSDEVVDPTAEMAWNLAIVALLDIEQAEYAGDASRRGRVPFSADAYRRLGILHDSLAEYLRFRGVHVKHHGIVRKLVANAGRLALIRRCLRWATGEFGFFGPVGAVKLDDCDAACRAAEFFLGRYLLWVPHVLHADEVPGAAAALRPSGSLMDRILAYVASKGHREVDVRWLRQQTLEGNPSTAVIRAALDEAVTRGRGRWADTAKKTFLCG